MSILRKNILLYQYYEQWIEIYKEGAIRKVTMDKYKLTLNCRCINCKCCT